MIVRSLIGLSKWYIHETQTKRNIQLKQFDTRYEKHSWFNIICEQTIWCTYAWGWSVRFRTRCMRMMTTVRQNICPSQVWSVEAFTYTPCPNSAPSWPSSYRPLIMKHSRDLLWRDSANFHVFLFVPPQNLFNSNIKDTFYRLSYHTDFSGQTELHSLRRT